MIIAEPSRRPLNPAGTVHGGFAATLLDRCTSFAAQSTLEKGVGQTTLECKISLLRPITPETGRIDAEGIVLSRGWRIGAAEGRITDGRGRLLALRTIDVPDLSELILQVPLDGHSAIRFVD